MTGAIEFHTTNTPAAQLLRHLEDEMLAHPTISRAHAEARVRERYPQLVALDHAGLPEDPGELVDPGLILGAARDELMAKGWSRDEATAQAGRLHPEAFAAWAGARMMPANLAPAKHEASERVYRSADAGHEIMRLTEEAIAADATLTVDSARRQVMARDPALTAAYCEQRPLPTTPQPSKRASLVEAALIEVQKMQAELAKLKLSAPPAPVKKLHRSPLHRPIRDESELKPGEILLHKLSGGFYAVPECGA